LTIFDILTTSWKSRAEHKHVVLSCITKYKYQRSINRCRQDEFDYARYRARPITTGAAQYGVAGRVTFPFHWISNETCLTPNVITRIPEPRARFVYPLLATYAKAWDNTGRCLNIYVAYTERLIYMIKTNTILRVNWMKK